MEVEKTEGYIAELDVTKSAKGTNPYNDGINRGDITGDYQLIKNDQQADTEKE
jgi:hypothetical protein